ncbi:hypothetical protein J7384_18840 [Endozoicomonas sp. G2_1]|uniref:hypothetical protein n=1 Tax=Endozoicomonas sp. G2_1 TaxID=2821091 RepID=UPI001ADCB1F1|nr:hypothetical protein [Endozoicomonas sp. G2_1]MBO9492426.1 hypothetical protein [Endozoicomonas sp. G2_1]
MPSLVLSSNAISQNQLTAEQQKVAEVYASYVSNQAFVTLCSKLDKVNDYEVLFKFWTSRDLQGIEQGKMILSHHYSSQNIEIDEVFKWKIDAEKNYFNASSKNEKIVACKNLLTSITNSGS